MGMLSTKDRHEFKPLLVELEERPANPLAHWLFIAVVSFMILSALWLYFAQIDVVVSARGKIIPDGEIKIVQPIETGVIAKIHAREGDLVEKGEVLMEIDPSITETNLESKKEHLQLLTLEHIRILALINQEKFISPISVTNPELIAVQERLYITAKSRHEEQLKVMDEQSLQSLSQNLALLGDKKRLTQLFESAKLKEERLFSVLDIIARKDYEAIRDERMSLEEQIMMKTHEITQNEAKIAELSNQKTLYLKQYKNDLLEELAKKRNEAQQLQAEVNAIEFKKAKQYIIAPCKGYIGKLYVHSVAGVITPAEKLMSIIPVDTQLIVKVSVLNQDIGFIEKGMQSAIKIDTFTYQKYGLLQGEVIHISDDAIEDEKLGLIYEVFIKPNQTYLEYNSKQYHLHIGMSVQAEMKVGMRRMIEFFIYPAIRYLDEGLSVR